MTTRPSSLYRDEVLKNRHAARLGRVSLRPPALLAVFTFSALFIGLAVAALLILGKYSPRAVVVGYLAPAEGLVKIFPTRTGRLERLNVKEGETVAAGQLLATVISEESSARDENQSASMIVLQQLSSQIGRLELALQELDATTQNEEDRLANKAQGLRLELKNLQAEHRILQDQRLAAELVLKRIETLKQAGFVTDLEMAEKRRQYLDLEREAQVLSKNIAIVEASIQDAILEMAGLPNQALLQKTKIRNDISSIRQQVAAAEAARGFSVTAPIAGMVTAVQTAPGKPVTMGVPLLAIVALGASLEAQLLVPTRSVGFVKQGQAVRLKYSAFPYQQYGSYRGKVTSISRATFAPEELDAGLQLSEPVYRVSAQLNEQAILANGQRYPLQAGMLLEADLLQESRPIWTWLLTPLLSLRGGL